MKIELNEDLQHYFSGVDAFDRIMALKGQTIRKVKRRHTFSCTLAGKKYYIKKHGGIGWAEILKDLLRLRKPVLGAANEMQALKALYRLKIDTITLAGFGRRGLNPARQQSFIITEELKDTFSLNDLADLLEKEKFQPALKFACIKRVAGIVRTLHKNGINHRDLYLSHFRIGINKVERFLTSYVPVYLMDLHRAQIRNKVPSRWLVKDLGALYFSSVKPCLTRRDYLRFIQAYCGKSLRECFTEEGQFWEKVRRRAEKFYQKDWQKPMPKHFDI